MKKVALAVAAVAAFAGTAFATDPLVTVILSVPDRRVLSMRIDATCETNDEALELIEDLIATFKPLGCAPGEGTKLLSFNWVDAETIFCSLSELKFGFQLQELIEEAEDEKE